ncbi:ATP-dependent DNA helicase DinG [Neobacillus sp. D3-1R]|uniref:ATP-dependent DNA helicase DinG n=1 Tax=Neobacillus sp. D3-1R TaxID=3445778 RepID=UPI003F9EBD86
MNNKFVVIDLETTGNSPKKGDRIIQFAAVVIENGKVVETFSSFVNPKVKIPIFIEELTGITDDMVKDAPHFEDLAPKVQSLLEDAYFVAHNVLFDLSFLQEELLMANQEGFFGPVIDTVELSRFLFPTIDSYKLSDLAILLGYVHERPHQADSDAEVTAELLLHFLDRMLEIPLTTFKQLAELSGGLKSDIQLLFDDILELKSTRAEEWQGDLEVINGLVLRQKIDHSQIEEVNNKGTITFPFHDELKEGQFQKTFPHFQKRSGQFYMMNEVFKSFSKQQHLVLEAGTGIGKTLGYLFPAAYFSKMTGSKVMVSTYTIQLQNQLITNDIPLLKKMLPFDLHIALLKGKMHYLNLSKFEESLHEIEDNYDSCLTKMQILIWLLHTETGDVDELNLSSGGQIFWNRINHGQHTVNDEGPWVGFDFYERAKKKVANANLIITNHSLLLSDLSGRQSSLPKVDYVVLDEGHHFHKVAFHFLGSQLDYFKIRLLLNQFGLVEQKNLTFQLNTWIRTNSGNKAYLEKINRCMVDLFFEMDEFFKAIRIYVKNILTSEPSMKVSIKIDSQTPYFKNLFHTGERFSFLIKEFIGSIEQAIIELEKQNGKQMDPYLRGEISQACDDLSKIRETISKIFLSPSDKNVAWIEIDFRAFQNSTTVYLQPVSIAEDLQENFFSNLKSVLVTSATLSIDNQFDYIINELGLHEMTKTIQISSPFDYRNKVKLLIPQDLPDIKMVSLDDYVTSITEQIISIAEVTKGRMLLLFTSHEMLRKTYALMKESGLLEEYALIAQGITSGSRSRLTRTFQKFEKAILFGTSSFWEGIDIPGEDLSCLVMVRLPFTPPEEPFMQAKCEEVKKHGGNPFMEVSLPEAVLRFKQGFGRLIRTERDKGVMIVLDRRIITTKYGRKFIQSIPDIPIKEKPLEDILEIIHSWLD